MFLLMRKTKSLLLSLVEDEVKAKVPLSTKKPKGMVI